MIAATHVTDLFDASLREIYLSTPLRYFCSHTQDCLDENCFICFAPRSLNQNKKMLFACSWKKLRWGKQSAVGESGHSEVCQMMETNCRECRYEKQRSKMVTIKFTVNWEGMQAIK